MINIKSHKGLRVKMAKRRKLTSEERGKIVEIYRAGLVTNIALLARKFNVNKTTISRILRKRGIRPPLRQHLWKVTIV
ncbi:MAG: helix-turn-helix domain-containing protein, partial [Candidatus Jordarchaeales archaeon]